MQGTFRQISKGRFGYDWAFKFSRGSWSDPSNKDVWADVICWCTNQYGPAMDEDNSGTWGIAFGLVVFDYQKDAALFKLSWC